MSRHLMVSLSIALGATFVASCQQEEVPKPKASNLPCYQRNASNCSAYGGSYTCVWNGSSCSSSYSSYGGYGTGTTGWDSMDTNSWGSYSSQSPWGSTGMDPYGTGMGGSYSQYNGMPMGAGYQQMYPQQSGGINTGMLALGAGLGGLGNLLKGEGMQSVLSGAVQGAQSMLAVSALSGGGMMGAFPYSGGYMPTYPTGGYSTGGYPYGSQGIGMGTYPYNNTGTYPYNNTGTLGQNAQCLQLYSPQQCQSRIGCTWYNNRCQ